MIRPTIFKIFSKSLLNIVPLLKKGLLYLQVAIMIPVPRKVKIATNEPN